jgi:two-component system sensor histidine kinase BaeS
MEVRGIAPHRIDDFAGGGALLFAVPEPPGLPAAATVPRWVATTCGVALVAVLLTFLVSRRVLGPISALTAAVARLEGGDLSARVEHDGGDAEEIRTLTRGFNRMVARLEEQERLRRQLVTDVAHELRSPVTNLRCGLEAVQDGLAAFDRAALDGLHDEVLYLQRLIADLQDLSLAEAGRLDLRADVVDVAAIARRAAAAVTTAPGAPIVVSNQADDARVRGDDARLEQGFRNLLSTARRHTPASGTIDVSVERLNGSVRAHVRDSGEGIAAEHLPHVFDRFYRADGSRSRATGGAGLGLAIARQLVTTHGGTLAVQSEGRGRGATFTIELPAVNGRL